MVVRGETRAWSMTKERTRKQGRGGDGVHVCQLANATTIGEAAWGEGGVRTEDDAPG